ncbi:hypothetical protein Tco_1466912 [Tanacetum coccineum]
MDALALTTCYPAFLIAFLITTDVPVIYMHQFWDIVNKHGSSYRFKIDNKRFDVNVEVFKEILNICPRILGQDFADPPYEEETLAFIRKLGHSREIKFITDVIVDHLHQPWKNLDFVALIWEEFAYQIDNKDSKKQDKMYYPRFTKVIINHFLTKNLSILMRNRMFMHTTTDDTVLGILKFISKHEDVQVYGALLPKEMTNPAMLNYDSFKTYYAIATRAEFLKLKKIHKKPDLAKSSEETPPNKKSIRVKRSAKISPVVSKNKEPAKADTSKGEGTDEGTSTKLGVPNAPKLDSKSKTESWGNSDKDDDDDDEASNNNSDINDDDGDDNDDDDDDNDDDSDGDDDVNADEQKEKEK